MPGSNQGTLGRCQVLRNKGFKDSTKDPSIKEQQGLRKKGPMDSEAAKFNRGPGGPGLGMRIKVNGYRNRTQPRNQTNAADDEGFKDQGSNNQGLRIQEFNHGNYGRSQQWRIHRFKEDSRTIQ
ncbi:hypothetical protein KQX54_000737 [Cotesia glomerata]|uniref:Uncharacterized protein n=1 Tax=Cotesia glomerata TaxID=32391 RepID=A0AAV7I5P3_COTGL|nr:hypothetical protein KQX54_000737 [Cotesia glomerata]